MVIVGVAMAGIISSINVNVQHSADPVVKKQALAIAESMLEEVMLQNFSNPSGGYTPSASPPPIAERNQFDDVGDYQGYTSSGVYSMDNLSVPISGLSDYTVSVLVVPTTDLNGIPATKAKRITITVTGPLSTRVILESYRTDYGS
jgi:MSHA pilin protein MshD